MPLTIKQRKVIDALKNKQHRLQKVETLPGLQASLNEFTTQMETLSREMLLAWGDTNRAYKARADQLRAEGKDDPHLTDDFFYFVRHGVYPAVRTTRHST